MGTDELRHHFHIGGLFQSGRIRLTYTHYDRMIVGGAMPAGEPLALEAIKPTGTKKLPRPPRADRRQHRRRREPCRPAASPMTLGHAAT